MALGSMNRDHLNIWQSTRLKKKKAPRMLGRWVDEYWLSVKIKYKMSRAVGYGGFRILSTSNFLCSQYHYFYGLSFSETKERHIIGTVKFMNF